MTSHRSIAGVGWVVITLLVVMGVSSAMVRAVAVSGGPWVIQFERGLLGLIGSDEHRIAAWITELQAFDARFAAHAVATRLHVLAGALFLALAPFQFSSRIRARRALFAISIVLAVIAVRRGEVRRHREWMVRAFGIAVGISVIRIIGLALQMVMPLPIRVFIGPIFWAGWGLSLLIAEWWIRSTRAEDFA